MRAPVKIFFASSNPGKLAEFRALADVDNSVGLETHEARPVAMQAGTMRIGNGGPNDGYVTPDYYVYAQFLTYGSQARPRQQPSIGKASTAPSR